MIIGITGCPGSGKSVLSGVLAEKGWILIDADSIGHNVVENNSVILNMLADVFGADIIGSDGRLNRGLLASRAFENAEKTRLLNGIVHPALISEIKKKIDRLKNEGKDIVVDCALIFEWGIENIFDVVVTVQSDEELMKSRLMKRDSRSEEQIKGIFNAQFPQSEKVKRADIVISNNSSLEKLKTYGLMISTLNKYIKKHDS
jgi:dephospho-CoA kinase